MGRSQVCREPKLVSKTGDDLGKLQNVTKVDSVNGVLVSVDVRAAVLKSTLRGESRRVTSAGGRGVVRATVSTLGVNSRERRVLSQVSRRSWVFVHATYSSNDLLEEGSEASINVIGEDSGNGLSARLDVASHILVEHGLDLTTVTLVLVENSATSEKTGFFTSVPVELDGVRSLAGCNTRVTQEDTESLKNGDSSRTIVI